MSYTGRLLDICGGTRPKTRVVAVRDALGKAGNNDGRQLGPLPVLRWCVYLYVCCLLFVCVYIFVVRYRYILYVYTYMLVLRFG